MFRKNVVFLICLLSAFPSFLHAYGGYNNIIWIPADSTLTPSVRVTPFQKDSYVTSFVVSSGNGSHLMKTIESTCSNFPLPANEMPYANMTTKWLMFRDSNTDQASKISYSFDKANSSGTYQVYKASSKGGPAGYTLVAYDQNSVYESSQEPCLEIGVSKSIQVSGNTNVTGQLNIDPQNAKPGHYRIKLDMAWGYEENKYDIISGSAWNKMGALLSSFGRVSPVAEFDIISQCSYSTNPVELDHGTISLKSGVTSYVSNKYPLTISCDKGETNVNVSLKGMDSVSGKTINYTQCGNSGAGTCRISFDSDGMKDAYNETVKVTGSKTIQIKSDYYPGNTPKPGSFTGNAVLTINVL